MRHPRQAFEPPSAAPPPPPPPDGVGSRIRWPRWPLALAVVALVAGAVVTIVVVMSGGDGGANSDLAEAGTTSLGDDATTAATGTTTTSEATSTTTATTTSEATSTSAATTSSSVATTEATEPPPPADPVPPSDLRAEFRDDGTVRITWTDATGEAGYRWEMGVFGAHAGGSHIGNLPADSTQYFGDVDCGLQVTFDLVAVDPAGAEIGRLSGEWPSPACTLQALYGAPIRVASSFATAEPGATATTDAVCPEGTALISGGYSTTAGIGESPRGFVLANMPRPHSESWAVAVWAPAERAMSVRAWALCLAGAETELTYDETVVASGSLGSTAADCPAGATVTGGGWAISREGFNPILSLPDANGWRVTVFDETSAGPSTSLRSFAVCLRDERLASVETNATATLELGAVDSVWAPACPEGTQLTGGGFSALGGVFESLQWSMAGWLVDARHHDWTDAGEAPPLPVTAIGVCVDVVG